MTTRIVRRPRDYYRAENGPEILAEAGLTLSVPEAAAILGLHRGTAYTLVREGTFPTPVMRLGSQWRVSTAEIRRLLGLPVEPQAVAS